MAQNNAAKVKQPPVLFDKTQSLISQLNSRLGGRLITYWNNPRGTLAAAARLATGAPGGGVPGRGGALCGIRVAAPAPRVIASRPTR